MDNDISKGQKSIMECLGQIPALTEACENIMRTNEETLKLTGRVLEHGIKARVPEEELQKVSDAAAEGAANSTCKLPSTEVLSREIAKGVGKIAAIEVESAVKDAVARTRIRLEHTHTFVTLGEAKSFLERKTRNWIVFLTIWSFLVTGCLAGCLLWYFNSDVYYANEYQKIFNSKYTNEEESRLLGKDVIDVGFLPKEFYSSKKVMKGKIKRDKQIIKERKAQAQSHKGKYSTTPAIER